jgi:hypothetical protein
MTLMTSWRSVRCALAVSLLAGLIGGCECGMPIGSIDRDGGRGGDARSSSPRSDECGNGLDDDQNGRVDDGCPCAPGESQRCFSGAITSNEEGACTSGTQTCAPASGTEWGDWGDSACAGEVLPDTETCDGSDADCDGAIDEGCPCTDGATTVCGAEFVVAPCMPGTQTCRGGAWSGCEGAVGPSADVCEDGIDNDCDGNVDELCGCMPEPEICRDALDNDCDGETDEPACTPDWPRDAGVPVDAMLPPPPSCDDLVEATTGGDWIVTASPVPDGTGVDGTGATVEPARISIDAAGNVYVLGTVCDGQASIAGFTVSSYAVVAYPRSTCNVWLVSLTREGTLRYGWSPRLADLAVPPPRASGPFAGGSGLAPDGLGGVWITGGFAGVLELAPGRTFSESTAGFASQAFLVHIDASGAVLETIVVGEPGTGEGFSDVMLTDGGDPVVVGGANTPLFAFGSALVRAAGGVFVARVEPSGEPHFVTIARPDEATGEVYPGRLTRDPDGNIVLAGGSNGPFTFGTVALPSADRERGQAWLWTMSSDDGSTLDLRSWQAAVGYYAHAQRARVYRGFTGIAGILRGTADFDGAVLSAGTARSEDPLSPFAVDYADGVAAPVWARVLTTVPYDAFHALDAHFDWNACHETMLVAEGMQGSTGPTPTPPVGQVDFGAGLVAVPEDHIQLVQWSPSGALDFHREISVASGFRSVVNDAAWSPRERLVVVGLVHRTGFTGTLSVRRFAFR